MQLIFFRQKVFHAVHFECPAQTDDDLKSDDASTSTSTKGIGTSTDTTTTKTKTDEGEGATASAWPNKENVNANNLPPLLPQLPRGVIAANPTLQPIVVNELHEGRVFDEFFDQNEVVEVQSHQEELNESDLIE
jgi:hypothetical protein